MSVNLGVSNDRDGLEQAKFLSFPHFVELLKESFRLSLGPFFLSTLSLSLMLVDK